MDGNGLIGLHRKGVTPKDDRTFEVPNWFEHVASEHQHARNKVVMIDQSSFSKFEIEGPGALEFLNHLCANQIDKPIGKVIYTQMCNERGTIECDMTIARLDANRFFSGGGDRLFLACPLVDRKPPAQ